MPQLEEQKQKEIYKPINSFEGRYEISNFGNVRSTPRYIFMKVNGKSYFKDSVVVHHSYDRYGYQHVSLIRNGRPKTIRVHILVWDHFGDSPRDGRKLQVDHIDNNKDNNSIFNLQLLPQRENSIKAWSIRPTSSKLPGVYWLKNNKKWRSKIQYNGKSFHLGCFDNEQTAYEKYLEALKQIKENNFAIV